MSAISKTPAGLADVATQTTLLAIEAAVESIDLKTPADPSTEAKQDTQITAAALTNTKLDTIIAAVDGLEGFVDGLEGMVDGLEALITTLNGYVDGLEGFVDGIEGALATLNAKDFATEVTLASVLAGITTLNTFADAKSYVGSARNDYTGTNVTTGAWVELIASLGSAVRGIMLFDSSGQTLELGVGAAASEARVLLIPPGGLNGFIPLKIASGARVSVRAVSANATEGELNLTALG
jgi:hypothetical protein